MPLNRDRLERIKSDARGGSYMVGPEGGTIKARIERERELVEKLRDDLADAYGFRKHPREPLLWELAWDQGHSSGHYEVVQAYEELAPLLEPLPDPSEGLGKWDAAIRAAGQWLRGLDEQLLEEESLDVIADKLEQSLLRKGKE